MPNFKKTELQDKAIDLLCESHTHTLLEGGSRSGKTFILIYALFVRALKTTSSHAVFRFKLNHIKASIWDQTIPQVHKICFPGLVLKKNKVELSIEFHNGSRIILGGLDDKERTEKILGTEYSTLYFNESSQIPYESVAMAMTRLAENSGLELKAYYDCNPPSKKHWNYILFHLFIDPESREKKDPSDYKYLLMNPADNKENLPKKYIEMLSKLPKKKRDRFLHGLYGDDNEKALWKRDWIDTNRKHEHPDFIKCCVAIDPAITATEDSDEHGLVVVGMCKKKEFWVVDDSSFIGSPNEWAHKAIKLYDEFQCDKIVAERNQGGDMVKSTIKNIDVNAPVTLVWASRGKYTRAEPVAALYEENRVHHVGLFADMEDELCDWEPDSKYSPNRLDAVVWAISWLAGFNNSTLEVSQFSMADLNL